jgi:hypothetical protein
VVVHALDVSELVHPRPKRTVAFLEAGDFLFASEGDLTSATLVRKPAVQLIASSGWRRSPGHGVGCGDGSARQHCALGRLRGGTQTRRSGPQVVVRDAAESDYSAHERALAMTYSFGRAGPRL